MALWLIMLPHYDQVANEHQTSLTLNQCHQEEKEKKKLCTQSMTNINLSTKPLSTNNFKVWGLKWKHVQKMINPIPIQQCKWVATWSHWSMDHPWRSHVCSKVGIGDGCFIYGLIVWQFSFYSTTRLTIKSFFLIAGLAHPNGEAFVNIHGDINMCLLMAMDKIMNKIITLVHRLRADRHTEGGL